MSTALLTAPDTTLLAEHATQFAVRGLIGLLITLFWIGLIVLIVVLATRRWRRNHPWEGQASSPERSLAERFAQGDITEQEYRSRLEVLKSTRPDR